MNHLTDLVLLFRLSFLRFDFKILVVIEQAFLGLHTKFRIFSHFFGFFIILPWVSSMQNCKEKIFLRIRVTFFKLIISLPALNTRNEKQFFKLHINLIYQV
jgi:hypothetical protein